ncbi:MAG: hypothetical protein WD934_00500, partial [Gemmatimonadales bacterium]
GDDCRGKPDQEPSAGDAPSAHVVDSVVAWDSALAAFRSTGDSVTVLTGATSRGELVSALAEAIATHDTAQLRSLVLSRAEFAWLYYPTAREAHPPYELPPDLMWFRLSSQSEQGISKALRLLGGRPVGVIDHACEPTLERVEGRNRLRGGCIVRRTAGGDTLHESLFGLIIERDGRYKFVSYANRL